MEAVGRLAGGVAHDFNNLLTAILGFSHLALQQVDDPALRADLEQVIVTAERAARLTSQLLAFSRQQPQTVKLADVAESLTALEPMLRCLIGADVALATEFAPNLGRVAVDPGQLEQVVMNLAVNARDAMQSGGRLTLRASTSVAEPDERRPQGYVVIEVADTGSGMDAETLARVFEPFFTTKEEGRGTGLGLSTVYGIVRQSGGTVSVESRPGVGTSFFVNLPIASPAAMTEAAGAAASPAVTRGSETVLVVEDEQSVRAVLVAALMAGGYEVIEARDGADAERSGLNLERRIDLLVTDVAMPGMSGWELARRLAAVRPNLRVLYLSGYADEATHQGTVVRGDPRFLQKPFVASRLLARVRDLLDRPVGRRG